MGKVIYQPIGKAKQYSEWAANFYNGCPNGCIYCFMDKGRAAKTLGGLNVRLKKTLGTDKKAYEIFKKELNRYKNAIIQSGASLHFNFISDPCRPETIVLNWRCISYAISQGVPVQVLTKMAGWLEHPDVQWALENGGELLKVGFTLTGRDDQEPNASPNLQRIETMRELHDRGIRTWASIEPIVDPQSSLQMVKATTGFCDHYKIGIMTGPKEYTPADIRAFKAEVDQMGLSVYWKPSLLNFIKKPSLIAFTKKP